jgi:hypothetical protein
MDVCAECGFDYGTLPRTALAPSLVVSAAQHAARLTADDDALRHRPAPDVWSPLEYACHVRDVLGVQRERMLRTQVEEEPSFSPMNREQRAVDEAYNEQDPDRVAEELREAGAAIAAVLDGLGDAGWARTGVYNFPATAVRDVDWIARHTLHELTHHLMDVDRGLAASTRPVAPADLAALIGLLALLEGALTTGDVDDPLAGRFGQRFEQVGLLPSGSGNRDLRQAVNDLNHRLRYALGEYDEPPTPQSVP